MVNTQNSIIKILLNDNDNRPRLSLDSRLNGIIDIINDIPIYRTSKSPNIT